MAAHFFIGHGGRRGGFVCFRQSFLVLEIPGIVKGPDLPLLNGSLDPRPASINNAFLNAVSHVGSGSAQVMELVGVGQQLMDGDDHLIDGGFGAVAQFPEGLCPFWRRGKIDIAAFALIGAAAGAAGWQKPFFHHGDVLAGGMVQDGIGGREPAPVLFEPFLHLRRPASGGQPFLKGKRGDLHERKLRPAAGGVRGKGHKKRTVD